MTVLFKNIKVAYTPVPKNACTTLKTCLHKLENDTDEVPEDIHKPYGSKLNGGRYQMFGGYFQFAVIRDPIDRFLSGYNNRILFHYDIRDVIKDDDGHDLPKVPDIEQFITGFYPYFRQVRAVGHHFAPQYKFLKHVHQKINIFRMNELESLRVKLAEHTGKDVVFERLQTGKGDASKQASRKDLTPQMIKTLERIYAVDYEKLGPFA